MVDSSLNRMSVAGEAARIKALFEFIKNKPPAVKPDPSALSSRERYVELDKPTLFDFNKVIPLISFDASRTTMNDLGYAQPNIPAAVMTTLMTTYFKFKSNPEEDMNTLARAAWGTKWSAYDSRFYPNEPNTLYFETAWSPPEKVIKRLSQLFPDVTITLTAADEGVTFIFKKIYNNGLVVSETLISVWDIFGSYKTEVDKQGEVLLKEIGMRKHREKRNGQTTTWWSRPKWAYESDPLQENEEKQENSKEAEEEEGEDNREEKNDNNNGEDESEKHQPRRSKRLSDKSVNKDEKKEKQKKKRRKV